MCARAQFRPTDAEGARAIRTHGWRRRDRIEIVAGILKECLVGQTYTELVYLMRIGAAQIKDYLNWMHSSGLLEKEIRNIYARAAVSVEAGPEGGMDRS